MYEQISEDIIRGRRLNRSDDVSFLIDGDLDSLRRAANRIREALCGNRVDLCTIINGRSGGILGMGETWEDRLDMAFDLAELHIDSIPLNALMSIPGTPLEGRKTLSEEDILRSIALFRFINPTADIRLAAGRNLMQECGKQAFFSGANATITGDMLTTSGNNTEMDRRMLTESGFDISRL